MERKHRERWEQRVSLKELYFGLPIPVKNYLYLGGLLNNNDLTPQIKEVFKEYQLDILEKMTSEEQKAMTDYITERNEQLLPKIISIHGKKP